jgi:DNA-binding HxlR family transcriptional regulator
MHTYVGFCPIAKALEILGDRWTLLVVRELLMDSHRFTDLHAGLPGIPRSLLVQRLRMLEHHGVVERRTAGKRVDYHLTQSGEELFDVVWGLGEWGQRWVNHTIEPKDVDPKLLMWDMHRRIHVDRLPTQRVVAQFDFQGASRGSYWLVLEKPAPSVCLQDLGFDIDLLVTADTLALHRVWMGHLTLPDALRDGSIKVEGMPDLVKAFPTWLALNRFAGVAPAVRALAH